MEIGNSCSQTPHSNPHPQKINWANVVSVYVRIFKYVYDIGSVEYIVWNAQTTIFISISSQTTDMREQNIYTCVCNCIYICVNSIFIYRQAQSLFRFRCTREIPRKTRRRRRSSYVCVHILVFLFVLFIFQTHYFRHGATSTLSPLFIVSTLCACSTPNRTDFIATDKETEQRPCQFIICHSLSLFRCRFQLVSRS